MFFFLMISDGDLEKQTDQSKTKDSFFFDQPQIMLLF